MPTIAKTKFRFAEAARIRHLNGPHDCDRLSYVVESEVQRSNRTGSIFCMLVVEITSADAAEHLTNICHKRLRLTDQFGFLDEQHLAIVLAETEPDGAAIVVSDLKDLYDDDATWKCHVYIYPTQFDTSYDPDDSDDPDDGDATPNQPLDRLFVKPLPKWKRVVDIVGAVTGLLLTGWLVLLAGAIVKLTSKGPMFFVQWRDGLGGRPFRMIKLRTMQDGADEEKVLLMDQNEQDGPAFKIKNDPRVTGIGKILRTLSIDELPQFINVLRGDMSLVGPRPLPCHESELCEPWQRRRLDVTPGLTCTWQVSGRSLVSFDEWARMDIEYAQTRSFVRDLKLIVCTLPALILKRGT